MNFVSRKKFFTFVRELLRIPNAKLSSLFYLQQAFAEVYFFFVAGIFTHIVG